MAKTFCIPKLIADELKAAAKRKEIVMDDLYEMNSAERRALFGKYVDETTARNINAGFEEAMVSSQKDALKKWVQRTFTGAEKKTKQYKDVLNQIDELDQLGVLSPENSDAFLEDLVAQKLGIGVTQEEVEEINVRAKKLQAIADKAETDKFGNPTMEYWEARRDMQNYLDSLTPSHPLKVLSSTIGRGVMLSSLKSPITNIIGNTIGGLYVALEKRLANFQFAGLNGDLVMDYTKSAERIYTKTGYDITRMYNLGEANNVLGEHIVTSQGEGKIRAVGRVFEDVVFQKIMGTPDVIFAAMQKADTINLATSKVAWGEGLRGDTAKQRARELFLEATHIDQESMTDAAKVISAQATADAEYATYTNDSRAADIALGIRSLFNQASGNLRLGDILMPFAKTPANVVNFGLDVMGLSAMRSFWELPEAVKQMKAGNKIPMQKVVRGFIRAGLGLVLAYVLASQFKDDDFMGAYPTSQKEKELMNLRNAVPNSIRIGDKWVSMDYFGALAAPMIGIMYARKYGSDPESQLMKYIQAGVQQGARLPGFDVASTAVSNIQNFAPNDGTSVEDNIMGFTNSLVDQISARLIPAMVSDFARAIDPYERSAAYNDEISQLKAKIPGLRETLPVKKNVMGEQMTAEPPISRILFGSRLKTAQNSDLITELTRLQDAGQLPSITDPEKTSTRVQAYKTQVDPAKYSSTMDWYKSQFEDQATALIKKASYQRLSDEDKKNALNDLKATLLDRALLRGGYKKPKN